MCSFAQMIHKMCMYKERKHLLPAHYKNRAGQKTSRWFYTRTPWEYQVLFCLDRYAPVFVSILIFSGYSWFVAVLNYMNTLQNNAVILLYGCGLAYIVLFHEKYREASPSWERGVKRAFLLQAVGIVIALGIAAVSRINPGSSFTKYFILEEAVLYAGIILYSINYSNTILVKRALIAATALYSLKAGISFQKTLSAGVA
ncbi:uncharacterized protein NEMAJ01_1473 [Nematocida major]|uniref:uncharacterized protein n=1 Tax=Nematocida major TaxID=1912982 RepID=UPI002008A8C8|nr:uncharacterized protein NEMAJ01_1473 [Nematocida major]KAH9386577.1 hypothetical protein NEMAJ01_1473 [Nematocida major]